MIGPIELCDEYLLSPSELIKYNQLLDTIEIEEVQQLILEQYILTTEHITEERHLATEVDWRGPITYEELFDVRNALPGDMYHVEDLSVTVIYSKGYWAILFFDNEDE